jgi:hypothetical protein
MCGTHYRNSHVAEEIAYETYRKFYKLVVQCLRCSSTAPTIILQRKLVEWLCTRHEPRAAAWFGKYWTGGRRNYMVAQSTRTVKSAAPWANNNLGVEGNRNGVKEAVCGTAGSTFSLAASASLSD